MYGTRDAAQNLEREYTSKLSEWGFVKGRVSPCVFNRIQRALQAYVHGGDFVVVGNSNNTAWFKHKLEATYEIKCTIMGSGEKRSKTTTDFEPRNIVAQ